MGYFQLTCRTTGQRWDDVKCNRHCKDTGCKSTTEACFCSHYPHSKPRPAQQLFLTDIAGKGGMICAHHTFHGTRLSFKQHSQGAADLMNSKEGRRYFRHNCYTSWRGSRVQIVHTHPRTYTTLNFI